MGNFYVCEDDSVIVYEISNYFLKFFGVFKHLLSKIMPIFSFFSQYTVKNEEDG